jgi:hypothetical protein
MSFLDTIDWKYLYFLISLILIFILQRIVLAIIRKTVKRNSLPEDLVNGLRIFTRFGVALLILYSAVIILKIGDSAVLSLSIFLGSLVSFASIHTIQNFVSGFYIIITKPIKVNDFVKIGSSEGVVTEISLNYSTLLNFEGLIESIPNKKIISSIIINYDKKVSPTVSQMERLSWADKVMKSFDDHEVTHYTFVWGAPLIDLKQMKAKFDKICKKYESIFGFLPEYLPYKINHRFEFTFILRAKDPIIILKNKTNFLDDIAAQFH